MLRTACFLLATTLACNLLPAIAFAAERDIYFGTAFMESWTSVNEVETTPAGDMVDDGEDDAVSSLGFALGLERNTWRYELEYLYRYRFDLNLDGEIMRYYPKHMNNLNSQSITLNILKDIGIFTGGRFFAGVGIGTIRNRSESDVLVPIRGVGEVKFYKKNTVRDLTWNLQIGWQKTLASGNSWLFSYRYADLGEIDSGQMDDPTGYRFKTDSYVSHDFSVGYRFSF
ncbi:hypothetical protein [Biformimicrobium ophioploci]|uniref:Outer membrane protein beta-barrel domain-containing protein n=1 Tax=Biformimicrobium ophioploci TaxID=3036711 RepID=A0ABQ6M2L4_9GAMM|nr:hypothetical protein [Microbulbifer sp. NKW57]GMG88561.1 hypothetical protein MNKW57_28820 [Microbulbifer sp. NKW57]